MTRPLRVAAEERSERRPHIIERRGVPTQKVIGDALGRGEHGWIRKERRELREIDGRSASASQGARVTTWG